MQTAKRLQSEIGGEIVFFYHDSDHDPRETKTVLRHRKTDEAAPLNFSFANKIQKKFSPLYLKRVDPAWQQKTLAQLPNYVDHSLIDIFKATEAINVADFCLQIYGAMGLLEGIKVMRSADPLFRQAACQISDFFVDLPYENEIVRARYSEGAFKLHEGGEVFIDLPAAAFTKAQISPTRDSRLRWMQSVINCTHYVSGAGEQAYLNKAEAGEINFCTRDTIDRSDEAFTELA